MRLLAMLALSVACVSGGPTVVAAQRATVDTASHSPVERWLNVPTRIVLSRAQRKTVDSLRSVFDRESARADADSKTPEARMAAVSGTRARIARFQTLVRAALTHDQQLVFDKNLVTAPRALPRP